MTAADKYPDLVDLTDIETARSEIAALRDTINAMRDSGPAGAVPDTPSVATDIGQTVLDLLAPLDAFLDDGAPSLVDLASRITEAVAREAGAVPDTPPASEPDWEDDGCVGWLTAAGPAITIDPTGGRRIYRLDGVEVPEHRVRALRDDLTAALTWTDDPTLIVRHSLGGRERHQ